MKTKFCDSGRILEAVHETAADLHRAGFIDMRRMRRFEALCLDFGGHCGKAAPGRVL
jgi:putative transcriptional regulator